MVFRDKLTRLARIQVQQRPVSPVIVKTKPGKYVEVAELIRPFVERLEGLFPRVFPRIRAPEITPFTPYPMKVIPRFNIVASLLPREIIYQLAESRYVDRIFPDQVMRISQYPVVPAEGVFRAPHRVLKEITFTSSYWVKRAVGADIANRKGFTGRGVLACSIDTGCSRVHEQTRRVIFETTIPAQHRDENGHGTHVTSLIGGVVAIDEYLSQRSRRRVLCEGMAPRCGLLAIKSLGYIVGIGSTSNIIEALDIAIERGSSVVNLSLGGPCEVETPQEDPYFGVFEEVLRYNVIPVVAAGNCLPANTWILTTEGYMTIHNIWQKWKGEKSPPPKLINFNVNEQKFEEDEILGVYKRRLNKGEKLYRIYTDKGHIIEASETHPFLTNEGWKEAKQLEVGDLIFEHPATESTRKIPDWIGTNNPSSSIEVRKKIAEKMRKGTYRTCPVCGKRFYTTYKRDKKYCSLECYWNSRREFRRCAECGRLFLTTKRSKRKTCSIECAKKRSARIGGQRARELRDLIAKRTREAMKKVPKEALMAGVIKGKITEIGPRALEKWRRENPKLFKEKSRLGAINLRRKGSNLRPTSIEIKLRKLLDFIGINYETEYPIFDKTGELICIADVAIPQKKIAIFADGEYWHNYPYGTEKDREVNSKLKNEGWKVLRFWEHELKEHPEEVKSILIEKLINGARIVKIEERTRDIWVYDIATKKNHTLIANGLILHNSGPASGTIESPGAMPNVLTVGAYDPITGKIAPFSSRGPTRWNTIKPDIVMPGVNIDSATDGVCDTAGDGVPSRYSPLSGTSMATPVASGLITLMRQCHRDVLGKILTLDEIKAMMEQLGHEKNPTSGWGAMTWQMYEHWLETEYGVKL